MTMQEAIKEIEKFKEIKPTWGAMEDAQPYFNAISFRETVINQVLEILRRYADDDNEKIKRIVTSPEGMKMAHEIFLACLRDISKKDMTCATCKYNDDEKRIGCEINWELQKIAENNRTIYCSEWEAKP